MWLVTILLYVFGGLVVLGLALFAFIGARHLTRGTPLSCIRFLEDDPESCPVGDRYFCEIVEMHVDTSLVGGNAVDLLFDGDGTYGPLFEDLRAAQRLITWHVFWFKPGKMADELKEILCQRARAGVEVLFLYDAYGSLGVADGYYRELADAGVEVRVFRPLRFGHLYKFQQRSHMRTVVVDGTVGYTGGFAICDKWYGDGRHPDQWRDTSVRVQGPVVRQLQGAFAEDWLEATGELLLGATVFPRCLPVDGERRYAGLLNGKPSLGSTGTERFFALSIVSAMETLYITNAYFVPNPNFRRLLGEAARRGVDVRVLKPSTRTDNLTTYYAGRAFLDEVLAAGVRVYEYQPSMVHAKTLVADRVWSAVGTTNFDNRSMALNNEVALMVHSGEVGERLHDKFLDDLEHAREIEIDEFRARGAWERVKERTAALVSRLL